MWSVAQRNPKNLTSVKGFAVERSRGRCVTGSIPVLHTSFQIQRLSSLVLNKANQMGVWPSGLGTGLLSRVTWVQIPPPPPNCRKKVRDSYDCWQATPWPA